MTPTAQAVMMHKMLRNLSLSLWGVYSVWWQHFKVYQSTWVINFIPPVSEPIFYLLTFSYGFSPLVGDMTYLGNSVSYPHFVAPGIIAIGIVGPSFFEGSFGSFTRLNFQKTWHALLAAPLSFTDVFLGEWFWAATKGIIAGVLTGLIAITFGLYDWLSFLSAIPLVVLGSLLFGGFGLWIAGFMEKVSHLNIPFFLFVIPMILLGGSYFPRDSFPPLLMTITNFLPLTNLVNLLRWPLGLPADWIYELVWLIGLTVGMARLAAWQIYPRLFHS
jgi:lipooligosaccharide transport system permease protein